MHARWGTGRVCIRNARTISSTMMCSGALVFSTGFSSFEGRPLKNLRKVYARRIPYFVEHPPPVNRGFDPPDTYRSFYDYEGLDLIKWENMEDRFPGHFGSRIVQRPVVKTGFIRLLQRQVIKFIKNKRRDKMNSYLLRLFHKDELCPDALTNIADFIV